MMMMMMMMMIEYQRTLKRMPCRPRCNLFPVQHKWTKPYLICPRHPDKPTLLEPAVPEVTDFEPSHGTEATESSVILKFVTELPNAQNTQGCLLPETGWYELQIQENDGEWVSQQKSIKSTVVRKKHLMADTTYRFRVRIVHNNNTSGWSEESAPVKHGHVIGKGEVPAPVPAAPAFAAGATVGAAAAVEPMPSTQQQLQLQPQPNLQQQPKPQPQPQQHQLQQPQPQPPPQQQAEAQAIAPPQPPPPLATVTSTPPPADIQRPAV